jgi:hypothetical protein
VFQGPALDRVAVLLILAKYIFVVLNQRAIKYKKFAPSISPSYYSQVLDPKQLRFEERVSLILSE